MTACRKGIQNQEVKPKLYDKSMYEHHSNQGLFHYNKEEKQRDEQKEKIDTLTQEVNTYQKRYQQLVGNLFSLRRQLHHSVDDYHKLHKEVHQLSNRQEMIKQELSKKMTQIHRKQKLYHHHFLDRFERNEKWGDQVLEQVLQQRSAQQTMKEGQNELTKEIQGLDRRWLNVNRQMDILSEEIKAVYKQIQEAETKGNDVQKESENEIRHLKGK
ncbi:hypothetical protein SAMN05421676_12119 [Salinibacillus kushneri]|uniref:Uncharacterized protein n=1 Tax=Salinibacillus kushneri TaxID=237682 RepID=A0A1I0JKD8_9BACI|nr:hypothetical protein [Salinibacillus kushneri]SEU09985.1 hypothetical protein SAMN05421676_12119 [Salinibacillus kushneri]